MGLTMAERRVLVKAFASRYQAAGKKGRGEILDEFAEVTGYSRGYASWILRWHGKKVRLGAHLVVVGDATKRIRRRRRRVYDEAVVTVLKRLWVIMDYICGKRLAPALGNLVEALERHGEIKLDPEVRAKLLAISSATIDRLLAEEKKRYAIKSRARTRPGTLLRHQIPIRTFADWDDAQPGFIEVDLAGHDGGGDRGDYIHTVTLTDISTTWTELAAARNKAQVWVFAALQQAQGRFPFPILGLDTDNGGEFINHHLVTYCDKRGITFTRSRPYRKNDNCFVEQKNYAVVRRFVGYARFDTDQACAKLGQLDAVLSEYLNFFVPSVKLIEKVRVGARVRRRYDRAKTPFERVLDAPQINEETKAALRERARTLNPAALMRTIRKLQRELDHLATKPVAASPPSRAVDGDGLRKAGPRPSTPIFPQPLEIAHNAIPTPPTAPTTHKGRTHAFT